MPFIILKNNTAVWAGRQTGRQASTLLQDRIAIEVDSLVHANGSPELHVASRDALDLFGDVRQKYRTEHKTQHSEEKQSEDSTFSALLAAGKNLFTNGEEKRAPTDKPII